MEGDEHSPLAHQIIDELQQKGEAADHAKAIAWVYKTGFSTWVRHADLSLQRWRRMRYGVEPWPCSRQL